MKKDRQRDLKSALELSIKFAKEYIDELCKINKMYPPANTQPRTIMTIRRALWTSLVIEIGRLFDVYEGKNKEVISLKKISAIKSEVDKIHCQKVIGKILKTRHTFTAHWAGKDSGIISVQEICNSNLKKILNDLDHLLTTHYKNLAARDASL